jgi:hypothetical protein
MRLQGVYMRFFTAAAILSLISSLLFGQAGTGTITGVVTDPAGAVIANASVEVRNTENNAPYPTVTTQTGAYTVPNLPPGPYTLTVSAPDFKRLVRAGLTVAAGQTIPVDVGLEVGAASESVTVQAEPSLLKTETGDMSHNITLEQLDDLPVLGIGTNNAESLGIRNPFNSVVFLPSVSYTANFNMIVNGAPTNTTVAPGSKPSTNIYGQSSAGFGVINETVSGARVAPSGTLNAVVGQLYSQPRSGTLIARFTF